MAGSYAMDMSGFVYIQYINLAQEPGYRCICSNRDRLSYSTMWRFRLILGQCIVILGQCVQYSN